MVNLSGTQLGKYQLHERIGRGGMSSVYRATRQPDNAEVAVKVMDPNPDTMEMFLKRFEQEARIVAGMRHPNILPLLDYGLENNHPFMVTPLVTGGTLADILRVQYLPPEEAGGWLYQVASALDHAHAQGVVHRDLKPTNILLNHDGQAFLTDFGIAKLLNLVGSLTQTGNVVGTPTYMAPEQWRGEEATQLTDVYGLGVLVYIMLTGKPPFHAETPHSLMYMHLNETPPSLRQEVPDIPEAIDLVVAKALAKSAHQRYPSAGEFSHDFQRALRGLETLAQRHPPAASKTGRPNRDTPASLQAIQPVSVAAPAYNPSQPLPSQPYYAPVQVPVAPSLQTGASVPYVVRPPRRRRRLWGWVWGMLIVGLLGGFAYVVASDPDRWLPQDVISSSAEPTLAPTLTTVPGSKPVVTINLPANGSTFLTGGEIIISVTAQDGVGISEVELRRFGFRLDAVSNPALTNTFNAEFRYTPRQPGLHILEIIPYRGTIAGDSAVLELNIR